MRKIPSSPKHRDCLRGGPWDGRWIDIPNRGTLTIRVGEYVGFYDGGGVWHERT